MILDDKFCMTKENLFFELIQVAIGVRSCLSLTPNESEWEDLYAMAMKQSLVGVCFAGIQRLGADADEGFARIGMGEMLYLTWMGMTAKIQQKNEVVNRQCADLQRRLFADGYRTAILKGQDYARYYRTEGVVNSLQLLRQSGDIDLWVDGNRDDVIRYVRGLGIEVGHVDIKHSDMHFFEDTEVEVHFLPSWMYCPLTGMRLLKWFQNFNFQEFQIVSGGIVVPPLEFSLVYEMVHIYRHFFSEGVGLRQVLDYYFLLKASTEVQRNEAMKVLESLHMKNAVTGIMWVIGNAFGGSTLLCPSNEKVGSFLLNEMMTAGNFGHDDTRYKHLEKSHRWERGFIGLKRNWKYLKYFPEEVLWSPLWKLWHYCWRKRKGYL